MPLRTERELPRFTQQLQILETREREPQLPDGWRIVWTCVFPGGWHSVGLQHADYDDEDEFRVRTGDGPTYNEALEAAIKATRGPRLWRWFLRRGLRRLADV